MSPLSPALAGALIGAVIGIAGYIGLRALANRIETMPDAKDPQTSAKAIRIAALIDLVIFPVAGFVVGPMLVK